MLIHKMMGNGWKNKSRLDQPFTLDELQKAWSSKENSWKLGDDVADQEEINNRVSLISFLYAAIPPAGASVGASLAPGQAPAY
jgi:hypothetical protein